MSSKSTKTLDVQFIPAKDLKAKYQILGHFYSVDMPQGQPLQCRSVLEIVTNSRMPAEVNAISTLQPDAVVVMMNPGSSKPLVEVNNRISADSIHELAISLVPTRPDTTQYQVMRLMHYCQWQHVRVLNLSDLRCAQSPLFIRQFQELEAAHNFDAHSIFSSAREAELAAKVPRRKDMPVVFAWGVSEKLDPLIERCQARLAHVRMVRGLVKEGTTNKYFHPLPTLQAGKLLWVEGMVACCRR